MREIIMRKIIMSDAGKKTLNTERDTKLYSDYECHDTRYIDMYHNQQHDIYYVVHRSCWQNEPNTLKIISRIEAIEKMGDYPHYMTEEGENLIAQIPEIQ